MTRQELRDIKTLNNKTQSHHQERNEYLDELLGRQNSLMGVIISKPTGKCIGTIENSGKINHMSHKDAKSPYQIVVKPVATQHKVSDQKTDHPANIVVKPHGTDMDIENMLMKNDLQGLPAKDVLVRVTNLKNVKVLGQTVDIAGKIVGLIVRIDRSNNYIQTKPSIPLPNIPILAILHNVRNNLTADPVKKKTPPVVQPQEKTPEKKQEIKQEIKQDKLPEKKQEKKQEPTKQNKVPTAAVASNATTSKIAPNSVPDEQCIEPVACASPPTEPVFSGCTASKPCEVTKKIDGKPIAPSALSGISAKMSSLWHRV